MMKRERETRWLPELPGTVNIRPGRQKKKEIIVETRKHRKKTVQNPFKLINSRSMGF